MKTKMNPLARGERISLTENTLSLKAKACEHSSLFCG